LINEKQVSTAVIRPSVRPSVLMEVNVYKHV